VDGDVNEYVDKDEYVVGHSPQTRSFAPAAQSLGLASTFAEASEDRSPRLPAKPSETALHARFAHREIPTPVLIPRAPEDSSQAEDRAFKRG